MTALWRGLVRINNRIESCWFGDLLATAFLFVGFFTAFVMAGVL